MGCDMVCGDVLCYDVMVSKCVDVCEVIMVSFFK